MNDGNSKNASSARRVEHRAVNEQPVPEGWLMHTSRAEEIFHPFDSGKTRAERPTGPLGDLQLPQHHSQQQQQQQQQQRKQRHTHKPCSSERERRLNADGATVATSWGGRQPVAEVLQAPRRGHGPRGSSVQDSGASGYHGRRGRTSTRPWTAGRDRSHLPTAKGDPSSSGVYADGARLTPRTLTHLWEPGQRKSAGDGVNVGDRDHHGGARSIARACTTGREPAKCCVGTGGGSGDGGDHGRPHLAVSRALAPDLSARQLAGRARGATGGGSIDPPTNRGDRRHTRPLTASDFRDDAQADWRPSTPGKSWTQVLSSANDETGSSGRGGGCGRSEGRDGDSEARRATPWTNRGELGRYVAVCAAASSRDGTSSESPKTLGTAKVGIGYNDVRATEGEMSETVLPLPKHARNGRGDGRVVGGAEEGTETSDDRERASRKSTECSKAEHSATVSGRVGTNGPVTYNSWVSSARPGSNNAETLNESRRMATSTEKTRDRQKTDRNPDRLGSTGESAAEGGSGSQRSCDQLQSEASFSAIGTGSGACLSLQSPLVVHWNVGPGGLGEAGEADWQPGAGSGGDAPSLGEDMCLEGATLDSLIPKRDTVRPEDGTGSGCPRSRRTEAIPAIVVPPEDDYSEVINGAGTGDVGQILETDNVRAIRRATIVTAAPEACRPTTPPTVGGRRHTSTTRIGCSVGKMLLAAGIRSSISYSSSAGARSKSLSPRTYSSHQHAAVGGGKVAGTDKPEALRASSAGIRRSFKGGGAAWGRDARGISAILDGPQAYRVFVASNFSKANCGGTALRRPGVMNAKTVTELMSHSTVTPKHPLLATTPRHLTEAVAEMFESIKLVMGDADPGEGAAGDDGTLRKVVEPARANFHMASELYCALIKQTHRCPVEENEERGFLLLACTAVLFPPPTIEIADLVRGHLALHRGRHDHAGGLALFTNNHLATSPGAWKPAAETDPMVLLSPAMQDCARNCFVPGTVFGGTLAETLRQEYYAQGIGEVTSPAPPDSFATARVPVLVQLLVQTIRCLGGVRTEGIFRRSGHAGAQAAFRHHVQAGDYVLLRKLRDDGRLAPGDLPGDNVVHVDVYVVANTLKAWLRCMKDPLVPADSYNRAVDAGLVAVGGNAAPAREEALRVMLALPAPNSATLEFLARFLHQIAGAEAHNKMGAKALAMVFSPNLLRNPSGSPLVFQANAEAETAFVQSLIEGSTQ